MPRLPLDYTIYKYIITAKTSITCTDEGIILSRAMQDCLTVIAKFTV